MVDYNQYVADLYRNELGRDPDQEGLSAWVGALSSGGLTPQQVADQIERSQEGVNYDLSRVYQSDLGRAPDEAGIQSWGQALQSGALSDDQFQQMVRQSPEYSAASVAQYQDLLNKIYQQEVGRSPDAGGAAQWAAALRSGSIKPEQLPGMFSNTNEGWVFDQYASLFGRQPDASERAWVDALENKSMTREQVLAQLMTGPEYQKANPGKAGVIPLNIPGVINSAAMGGFPGYVSANQSYAPMNKLADPRSQTFGFLYDTINQRLGRDVAPKGLLDVDSINAAFSGKPSPAVAAPASVNWAGGPITPVAYNPAPTPTPGGGTSTGTGAGGGTKTGTSTNGGTYYYPGPTNETYNQWAGNPNIVGGLLDARNLVTGTYQSILNRAPDDAGLNDWTQAILGGMSQQQLQDAFRASAEYQALQSASNAEAPMEFYDIGGGGR